MNRPLRFSTDHLPPQDRAAGWTSVIAEAYFPLQLHFRAPLEFNGRLIRKDMGHVSLSRLTSSPANYERRKRHIREAREEEYLITIPKSTAALSLNAVTSPIALSMPPNDLFVAKVSKAALSERACQPDRFCAQVFGAT